MLNSLVLRFICLCLLKICIYRLVYFFGERNKVEQTYIIVIIDNDTNLAIDFELSMLSYSTNDG